MSASIGVISEGFGSGLVQIRNGLQEAVASQVLAREALLAIPIAALGLLNPEIPPRVNQLEDQWNRILSDQVTKIETLVSNGAAALVALEAHAIQTAADYLKAAGF